MVCDILDVSLTQNNMLRIWRKHHRRNPHTHTHRHTILAHLLGLAFRLLFAIRHRFFNTEKFAVYYHFVFGTKILSCSDECSNISCWWILCQKKCEHSSPDEYAFARTTHTMQTEEKHSWFIYNGFGFSGQSENANDATTEPTVKSTNFTVAKFRGGFGATNIKIVTRAFHHFPFFCLLLHYFSRVLVVRVAFSCSHRAVFQVCSDVHASNAKFAHFHFGLCTLHARLLRSTASFCAQDSFYSQSFWANFFLFRFYSVLLWW